MINPTTTSNFSCGFGRKSYHVEPHRSRVRAQNQRDCMLIQRGVRLFVWVGRLCNCSARVRQTMHDTFARTRTRTRNGAGLNILFGLLGQGGQPCYFDIDINDSAPAAGPRAFNAVTFSANGDPSRRRKRPRDSR